jgi:putative ABC transport system permease protein
MNIKDIFWLSYKDLREKKVRTALTIVMVMIGVASIIALSSQTQGISQSIQSSLDALGPTSIIITSVGSTGFTVADTSRIASLPNVSSVTPILTGPVTVLSNGQNTTGTLIGVSSEDLTNILGTVNLYQGTLYQDTINPAADIGYSIAFPSSLAGRQNVVIGQPLTVKLSGKDGATITVPVDGIFQQYGASLISVDSGVVVSMPAAEVLLHRSSFNMILVKATNTSSVNALSSLITTVYGTGARVITTQQLIQTTNSIIGSITLLLLVIAGISLVVAAIGIMNIMLIAVYERTHEIGILKALGFKNRHILTIFLFQAVIIGFVGGIVGIFIGAGSSYGLTFILSHATSPTNSSLSSSHTAAVSATGGGFTGSRAGSGGSGVFVSGGGSFGSTSSSSPGSSISYSPVFTPATLFEAILVAIIVSVLAGMYPAQRAAKMEPIQALRQL